MRRTRRNPLPQLSNAPEPENERRPLDREQVVQAALSVLDEVGLDGLNMRSVATKLNVAVASLYWHIRNKEELLDLLADAICADVREPDPRLPWREYLTAMAHECRRAFLSHRDAAQILAGTVPTGANRLRLMESSLRTFLAAGFGAREAVYAGFLANDYVTEFVIEESRFNMALHSLAEGAEEAVNHIRNYFASLSPQLYPTIAKLQQEMSEANPDERFQFGLEVLLDGLEKRLTRQ